jgi:hypothetical protein
MKKIDDALVQAASEGIVSKKALTIKLVAMAAATAVGIAGTILVQRAIESNSQDPE